MAWRTGTIVQILSIDQITIIKTQSWQVWFFTLTKVFIDVINDYQITSNWQFIKIIKGPGTSLQSSQKSIKSDSYLPKKSLFSLLRWKLFKNGAKCFSFHLESFFILKIILFYFLGHVKKLPDKKAKVNFKIYVVIDCEIE